MRARRVIRALGTPELTAAQLCELRRLLERRRTETEAELAALTAPVKSADLHLLDSKLYAEGARRRLHLKMARAELVALRQKQIRAALWRVSSGQYGSCLSCGEAIDYGRLRVWPEATLCRSCHRHDD